MWVAGLICTPLVMLMLPGCGGTHHSRTSASTTAATSGTAGTVPSSTAGKSLKWVRQPMTVSGEYLSIGPEAVAVDLSQVMTSAEQDRGTPMAVVCQDAGADGSAGEEYSCSATLPTGQPGGTTLYLVDGSGGLYARVGGGPPATSTAAAPPATSTPAGFMQCPAPAGQNKFAAGSASPGCGAAAAAVGPLGQLVRSGWAGTPPRALNVTYRGTSYALSCASAAGSAGEALECNAAGRPWMELYLDSAQP